MIKEDPKAVEHHVVLASVHGRFDSIRKGVPNKKIAPN